MTPPSDRAPDWTRSAVGAVLRLHAERVYGEGPVCAECRQVWPCATVKAINAADPLQAPNAYMGDVE